MERQKELHRSFHKSIEARSLPLPTADRDVRLNLRQLGEPQTLFGEGPFERRERLRAATILSLTTTTTKKDGKSAGGSAQQKTPSQTPASSNETFYTEGSAKLAAARHAIASLALPVIYDRLLASQAAASGQATGGQAAAGGQASPGGPSCPLEDLSALETLECISSIPADERPILTADLSCDENYVITGGISKWLRFWNLRSLMENASFGDRDDAPDPAPRQMSCRIQSVRCHLKNPSIVAVGLADGSINIVNSANAHTCLRGHELQINRLDFNPLGENWLASSSSDETWRYWDIEVGEELLLQEGHARGVYGLKHNEDGTLLASGDYGGVIKLWDLRVGKSILYLQEHLGPCLSFAWTNPRQILSSSSDHTIRIWDLRSPRATTPTAGADILAGHSHVISDLSLTPEKNWLMSSSHDKTTRIWNSSTFQCHKVLMGHEAFVFKTLASSKHSAIISTSYDRTIKIWKPKSSISER